MLTFKSIFTIFRGLRIKGDFLMFPHFFLKIDFNLFSSLHRQLTMMFPLGPEIIILIGRRSLYSIFSAISYWKNVNNSVSKTFPKNLPPLTLLVLFHNKNVKKISSKNFSEASTSTHLFSSQGGARLAELNIVRPNLVIDKVYNWFYTMLRESFYSASR